MVVLLFPVPTVILSRFMLLAFRLPVTVTLVAFTSVAATVLPEIVPLVVEISPPAVILVPALIVVSEVTVFPFKSPVKVPSLPDTSPVTDTSPVKVPSLPDTSPVVLMSPMAERPCMKDAFPVTLRVPLVVVPVTLRFFCIDTVSVNVPDPALTLPSPATLAALSSLSFSAIRPFNASTSSVVLVKN